MEKELRRRLLSCKTQQEFDMVVYDVVANTPHLSEWIEINTIFTETQKAWRSKLVDSLKVLIGEGVYGKAISFNTDYSRFKVYNVEGFKKFNPKVYHGKKLDTENKSDFT